MATLTVIFNPFNPNEKTVKTIENCFIYECLVPYSEDIEFVVSLNGNITENYEYKLKENDFLSIVPIPAGGGGGNKNVIRIVAMVALAVAAPMLAPAIMGATAGAAGAMFGAGVYGGMSGALILGGLQAAIIVGGGMLVNSLLPTPSASVGTSTALNDTSPTYAYNGGSNNREVGTTLPIMLGTARVTPPIIASYLSLKDDKQYYNALFAVNDGQVNSISDIEINGQAIGNFNGSTYSITYGTANQSAIGNFRDTATTFSLSRALNTLNAETTYSTNGNSIQELEIVILLSSGLFTIQNNGTYVSKSLTFEISYKKSGTSTWTTQSFTVSDIYKTTKRLSYSFKNLEAATYDIKVKRISAFDTNTQVANALVLDYINEIVYDDFIYPGVALLSVNALATDQLNSLPTVTCLVNNTGTVKPKNNPAWACYDLLKREGIPDSDINLTKFQEWADFCTAKNLTVGLYLDSQQELQSALNMVSVLGRGIVLQFGSIFTPIVEKVVDIPTQGFLFTGGNIIDSSFSISYVPYNERSNTIEVTYYDETDSYKSKTVQVQSHDFDSKTMEIKSSINLYGCTKRAMAASYAKFLLNKNRYISETVSFTAFVDAIACNVGDVIKVGVKYMTNTLADGRILGVENNNTLILDQEVELLDNEDYQIQIRCLDDEIITINIPSISVNTVTNTINIGTFPREINKFDVYALGRLDTEATNLYRVTSITRASDLKRKITAIEYNPDVYNDSAIIDVEPIVMIDNTTNVQAEEILIQKNDGTVDEILVISFNGNKLTNAIYLNGKKIGTTTTNNFEIKNLLTRGKTYEIKVNDKAITHTFQGLLAKVGTPTDLNINLLPTNTAISWSATPFAVGYKIYHNDVVIEDNIKSTTFNYKLLENGTHTFKVEALNVALTSSNAIEQTVVVDVPLSPNVSVAYKGENVLIKWEESNSTYPISHYIVSHADLTTIAKTTTYTTKVNWSSKSITIQAVDIAGNVSTVRTATSTIALPSITEVTSKVIDNNILLYWKQTAKTLPISYVEIKKGQTLVSAELIGTNNSTFANLFESKSDYYTYWITPVDSAGNKGDSLSTTALVNEPPDYVLNAQWFSDFSGTKNNAAVDSGKLYLGIKNESFQSHFTVNGWSTAQDQINAGYLLYAQPFATTSYYEEVFDYGTVLASTTATVTLDYERVGNGGFQIDISTSTDGTTWTLYSNMSKVTTSNFRYVKVKVSFIGTVNDAFIVNTMEVKLDSKIKSDSGKTTANAGDTNGTIVNFNKPFVDVQHIGVTPLGTTRKSYVCDFTDIPNPTFFKVYIYDMNGNRITSDFTWSAEGY
jgi:predicted phage tail protein